MKFGLFILIFTLFAGLVRAQAAPDANPLSANFYERLGVTASMSKEEIQKAYRKLAMRYHPDRQPDLDRTYFQNITEAWETFQDPDKRAIYDSGFKNQYGAGFRPKYSGSTQAPPERPVKETSPPPGWFENINAFWNQNQTVEMNLFRNLHLVREKNRAYMNSLMSELDWREGSVPYRRLQEISKAFAKGFHELNADLITQVEFQHAQNKVDAILLLPQTALFPEVVDLLLKGPRANYVVSSLLTQPQWRRRPEMGRWLNEVLRNQSPSVTMALVNNFIPTLANDSGKKMLLQKIISSASNESLEVLAKNFPSTDLGPDYREELELLLSKRNQQAANIFKALRSLEEAGQCQDLF